MVLLDNYQNMEEASIIVGMLEENGIPCYVSDDNNLYVPVFGGVSVYVREHDLDAARKLTNTNSEANPQDKK